MESPKPSFFLSMERAKTGAKVPHIWKCLHFVVSRPYSYSTGDCDTQTRWTFILHAPFRGTLRWQDPRLRFKIVVYERNALYARNASSFFLLIFNFNECITYVHIVLLLSCTLKLAAFVWFLWTILSTKWCCTLPLGNFPRYSRTVYLFNFNLQNSK